MGFRWKTDDRPQRHGWAPGEYIHSRCIGPLCRELADSSFIGAKRAFICADCAYAMPDEVPVKPKPDRKSLLLELREAVVRLDTMVDRYDEKGARIPRSHTGKYAAQFTLVAGIFKELLELEGIK